jgi:glucokinase
MSDTPPAGPPPRHRPITLGLDVGGSKTDTVAVRDGEILARVRLHTGWGPDAVVATILDAVTALRGRAGITPDHPVTIGIGIPGQIVPGTTRVAHAVNLGLDSFDLGAALADATGSTVRIENDVKAATLGAAFLRGGAASMAYLNLGTGIAAGVLTGGELWRGTRGAAGEIGHISIDPAGPDCRCGQVGCIEAFAGGGAIASRWGRPGALPVRDVFDAADAGDAHAIALRAGLAHGVAAAVRVLVLTADVDVVIIGGGLAALGERLLADVRRELRRSAAASSFLGSLRLDERIETLPEGSAAAALGAALAGAGRPAPQTAGVLARG